MLNNLFNPANILPSFYKVRVPLKNGVKSLNFPLFRGGWVGLKAKESTHLKLNQHLIFFHRLF